MKRNIIKNITIRQANIYVSLVLFVFTIIFVSLLVEEIYEDYEIALEQKNITSKILTDREFLIEKESKLKSLLIKTILSIVTLAFILFGIVLGLYKILNTMLQKDTQAFLDFFSDVTHRDVRMKNDSIFFKDFKTMVGYANAMVNTISEQKESLRELNTSLEERVQQKTADLENLLQSQKEFLRYTVHETNTPLSVILTSIELYNMKNKKDKQLSKIEAAAKNIFNIYDDLSYLVKKDQVAYPKKVINLGDYIKSRVDFFTEVAQLSKLEFSFNATDTKYHIYFNETKLQRIVDNTLTNAIKYTLAGEMIYIELKKYGSFIDMDINSKSKLIKDTKKVFDAYYREEKTQNGFGLGLRLVSTICDEEDVEIFVRSDSSNTSFSYRFMLMGD